MREPEDRRVGYGEYRPYLEALREAFVDRLGSSLLCLVLYGSVARGTARPDSDIDLLVVDVVAEVEQTPAARALHARGLHPHPSPLVLSEEATENHGPTLRDQAGSRPTRRPSRYLPPPGTAG